MRRKLAKKQNTCGKRLNTPQDDKKLKDAKAVRNNIETGEGDRPKHTGLKPIDAKPTPQKVRLAT